MTSGSGIPRSPPSDDGGSSAAAMLAADSSTDSVTELIDLERDAEDDHVVGGWDDSPPTISPPPQHQDPLQESPKKPSQTKRPSPLDEIVFIDDDDEPIEPAAETFTAASPHQTSTCDDRTEPPPSPKQRTSPRKNATKKPGTYRAEAGSDDDCVMLSSDDDQEGGAGAPTKPRKRKSEDAISLPSSSSASSLSSLTSPQDNTDAAGKCSNCRQHLANVKQCPRLQASVRSEKEALAHPNIAIEGFASSEEKPQALLTHYALHDRDGHMVSLTWGLMEAKKQIFISGHIKSVQSDAPFDKSGGVCFVNAGPITEYWMTGYEERENIVVGVSTDLAEYYLKKPLDEYEPLMLELYQQTALSKLVVEVLSQSKHSDLSYEDGLIRIEEKAPSVGIRLFSEEMLLRHAHSVVGQIDSYEQAEESDIQELFLMHSSFMKDLIEYSGYKPREEKSKKTPTRRKKEEPAAAADAQVQQEGGRETRNRRRTKRYGGNDGDEDYTPNYADLNDDDADYVYSGSRNPTTKPPPPIGSFATTTPLVNHVFECFFKDQIADTDDKKKKGSSPGSSSFASEAEAACGVCRNCLKQDCGVCDTCKTKVIFGGEGSRKEETCLNKICLKVDIMEVSVQNESDIASNRSRQRNHKRVEFVGAPLRVDDSLRRKYYDSAMVNDAEYQIGDCVMVRPDIKGSASYIGRIVYLLEEKHEKIAHVQYFCRGSDTVLGELSDKKELFALDDCEDVQLFELMRKVNVSYWPIPDNWSELGGTEEAIAPPPVSDDQCSYWFRLKYESRCARFTSVDYEKEFFNEYDPDHIGECRLCRILNVRSLEEEPVPRMAAAAARNNGDATTTQYEAFMLCGERFCVGDAAFVMPDAFGMPFEMPKQSNEPPKNAVVVDDDMFPEYYRHKGHVKGSNEQTPDPFRIVVIERIAKQKGGLVICVRKLFRPENTVQGERDLLTLRSDINEVFWSEDLEVIPAKWVEGKCIVRPKQVLNVDTVQWHEGGSFRFYFEKQYDSKGQTFHDLEGDVIKKYSNTARYPEDEGRHPEVRRRLRTLDVFAGCGGLSLGLEQAGIAESLWAIEHFEPAARAYELNNRGSTVILDDCNRVLEQVMDGNTTTRDGKALPQKGEVDLMCGGPPCQGFSMMNAFSYSDYSKFKNSLISSYLSYCDYYRPKFFILENVKNFASYNKNLVLKLCLQALVKMGYQCTFGVLQAGNFGVPQTRRRCILMAAAPGQVLPRYPEPKHVFTKVSSSLNVAVDKKNFTTDARWTDKSAPYRTITVRDALCDLPEIKSGATKDRLRYDKNPQSHFQRKMRANRVTVDDRVTSGTMTVLQDHICKNFTPLINERMRRIPLETGSDWRDLPNIRARLSDGTHSDKLIYMYKENGSRSPNAVCRCQHTNNNNVNNAKNKKRRACDPSDHQSNTLIPWAMNHTGSRHNNWAGIYGRISWDGFFSTTVTNPEPMGKQGRILHPEQHRVISVREGARSQGFPDSFRFSGTTLDKYRQIGNAVPPTMGQAIGMEIRKAVAAGYVVEEVLD